MELERSVETVDGNPVVSRFSLLGAALRNTGSLWHLAGKSTARNGSGGQSSGDADGKGARCQCRSSRTVECNLAAAMLVKRSHVMERGNLAQKI